MFVVTKVFVSPPFFIIYTSLLCTFEYVTKPTFVLEIRFVYFLNNFTLGSSQIPIPKRSDNDNF